MNVEKRTISLKRVIAWVILLAVLFVILIFLNSILMNPVLKLTGSFSAVMIWFAGMIIVPELELGNISDAFHEKRNVVFLILFSVLMLFAGIHVHRHLFSPLLKQVAYLLIITLWITGILTGLTLERKKISVVKAFVILASVLGMSYDFIMPVGEAPDEWVHFQTAYVLSNEMMGIDENADPEDIHMRKDDSVFEIMQTDVNEKKYEDYLASAYEPLHDDHIVSTESKALQGDRYFYILPACGITLGRILKMNSFWVINLGRLFNLFFSIFLTAFAVSVIPVGKEVLMVTSFIPTALQQNMSYSYDVPINAFSFLVIAVSVKMLVDEKYRPKVITGILTFVGIFVLLMGKRHAYFLLGLLPLFVWMERKVKGDQKKKDQIMKKIVILILILIICVLVFFFSGAALKVIPESHHMVYWRKEEGYTFWYFAKHPEQLIILPLRTVKYQTITYLTSYFGKWMGWFEIDVGILPAFVMSILLLFTVLTEKETIEKKDGRILFRLVGIGEILCIFAAFVFGFSRTSMYYIEGVQGRYLIAPVTLILLTFMGKIQIRKDNVIALELYLPVFVSAWTLVQILIWYAGVFR